MKSHVPHRLFPIFFILYQLACNLSNDLYLPAMPQIAQAFSVELVSIGYTIAMWLAGDTCFQWLLGPLSDRFGRKKVLMIGGIVFSLATFGCAFSQNLEMMLIARFIQGVGVCSMMIAGYASVHESYSGHQAVKMLAWITSISIIAPMIGPLLGGTLLLWFDWRWLFHFIQIIAIFSLIGLGIFMPNHTQQDSHALHPRKLLQGYLSLLQNKVFLLRSGTLGLIYAAIIAWITHSPNILITGFGLSSFEFGLSQSPIFLCYIIGAQLGQKWMVSRSDTSVIRLGLRSSLLGLLVLLSSFFLFPHSLLAILGSMSIVLLGGGIICAPLNRACFESSSLNKGITSAMFYTILMGTGTLWSILASQEMFEALLPFCIILGSALLLAYLCFKTSEAFKTNHSG